MTYWQVALGLSALAALCILWPLISHWWHKDEQKLVQARVEANKRLYDEHLVELQQQRANGDITDEEFTALNREQQRALLEDAGQQEAAAPVRRGGIALLVAVAIVVPLAAWLLYNNLGAKDDWQIHQLVEAWHSTQQPSGELETQLRQELTQRLQSQPNNTQNWYLLATLALRVQDFDQAVAAYEEIVQRQPESPQILAELAQAQFLQAGNQVTPEARRNTQKALQLDPNMPTALGLAGIDAFQQGRFQRAIDYWSHAVGLLGEAAAGSRALVNGIARAEAEIRAAGGTPEEPEPITADTSDNAGSASATIEVTLADDVELDANATVFVYLRAFGGPRMPLAIQSFPAGELPRQVQLDNSMAMTPGTDLAQTEQLEAVVRVSNSGDATPQTGDWQGVAGPFTLKDGEIQIAVTVSEQIP